MKSNKCVMNFVKWTFGILAFFPLLSSNAAMQQTETNLAIHGQPPTTQTPLSILKDIRTVLKEDDILISTYRTLNDLSFIPVVDAVLIEDNYADPDGDEIDLKRPFDFLNGKEEVTWIWKNAEGEILTEEDKALPISSFEGQTLTLQIQAKIRLYSRTGLPKTNLIDLESKPYYISVIKVREPSILVAGKNYPLETSGFPYVGFKDAHFDVITPFDAIEYDWKLSTNNNSPSDFAEVDPTTGRVKLLKTPLRKVELIIEASAKSGTDAELYKDTTFKHSFILNNWWHFEETPKTVSDAEVFCRSNFDTYFTLPIDARNISNGSTSSPGERDNNAWSSNQLWTMWGDLTQYGWGNTGLMTSEITAEQRLLVNTTDGQLTVLPASEFDTYKSSFACTQPIEGLKPVDPGTPPTITKLKISGLFEQGEVLTVNYEFNANSATSNDDYSVYAYGLHNKTTDGILYPTKVYTTGEGIFAGGQVPDKQSHQIVLPPISKELVNQVVEVAIEPINDQGTKGKIKVLTSLDSFDTGNEIEFTPGIIANGIKLPLTDNFAKNAFRGANYRLQLQHGIKSYDFKFTPSNNLQFDLNTGVVSFNEPILTNAPITITAKDRKTSKEFKQVLRVSRWIMMGDTDEINGYSPGDSEYIPSNATNNPADFCAINYPGSNPLPYRYIYTQPLFLGEFGVDTYGSESRSPNGGLLNEWGSLNREYFRNIPIPSLIWTEQIQDNNRGTISLVSTQRISPEYKPKYSSVSTLCYFNNEPVAAENKPQIKSLSLIGSINLSERLTVVYQFEGNSDIDNTNKSLYTFGLQGKTVLNQGTTSATLVKSGRGIITHGAVPSNAVNGFDLPYFTKNELNQVLELSIEPINGEGKKGDIATIDTTMAEFDGNRITQPAIIIAGTKRYSIGSNFPTVGFNGASFRVLLPMGIQNYDVELQNAEDMATVDPLSGIVKFTKPITDRRDIVFSATGKAGTSVAGRKTQHRFNFNHWYIKSTDSSTGFGYADAKFIQGQKNNNPFAVCEAASPGASLVLKTQVSNYSINQTGTLLGEWGEITPVDYPDNEITYNSLWLFDEFTNSREIISFTYDYNYIRNASFNTSEKEDSLKALCDFVPQTNQGVPEISNLVMKGAMESGGSIIVSYDFKSNLPNDTTDNSLYRFGEVNSTVYNPGTSNASLINPSVVSRDKNANGDLQIKLDYPYSMGIVYEFSIQPVNGQYRAGKIQTVSTQMTPTEGNLVTAKPSLIVNGARYDLNTNFPIVGFEGGFFYIQTKHGATNYDWNVTGSTDGITLDRATGLINFVKPILNKPQVTITATGKAGGIADGVVHSHTFNLLYWMVPSTNANMFGWALGDTGYNIEDTLSSPELWCQAKYPGSDVLSDEVYTLASKWGRLLADNYPGSLFTDSNSNYWLKGSPTDATRLYTDIYNVSSKSKTSKYGTICAFNMPTETDKPVIKNLKLDGVIRQGGNLTASYDFVSNTTSSMDASKYAYGPKGKTILNVGTIRESLATSSESNMTIGTVNPDKPGVIELPTITVAQLNTTLELSVQPINQLGLSGKIVTITTDMLASEGNNTIREASYLIGGMLVSRESPFIETAFVGARYSILDEYPASLYDWSIENATAEEIKVDDQTGMVTFLSPILDGRTIQIKRVGKSNTSAQGQNHTQTIQIKRWFAAPPNGNYQLGLLPGDAGYDANDPYNNPENYCRINYPGSVSAEARYYSTNQDNYRALNGRLLNEWGRITESSYPNNGINLQSFSYNTFWLIDTQVNPPKRYKTQNDLGSYRLIADNQGYGDPLCLLNPSPTSEKPRIENLTLSGDIGLDEQLWFTYDFISPINASDRSLYSFGIKGASPVSLNAPIVKDAENKVKLMPLTKALVNQVLELSVQPVDSNLSEGEIVKVDTQMDRTQGNLTLNAPNIFVNGYNFKLNSGFPQMAFKGASFVINTKTKPTDYDWAIQNGQSNLSVDAATGTVTFDSPYDDAREVTIVATGKSGTIVEDQTIEHAFTLNSWVDISQTNDISAVAANGLVSANEWCSMNAPGSKVMPVNAFSNSGEQNPILANPEGLLDQNQLPGRLATGGFINQWGKYSLLEAFGKNTGSYWLNELRSTTARYVATPTGPSTSSNTSTGHNVICQTVFGELPSEKPRVENVKMTLLADNETVVVTYDFIPAAGQSSIDNSYMVLNNLNWTTYGTGKNKFIDKSLKKIIKTGNKTEFTGTLNYSQINSMLFEISIQPVDGNNQLGDVVTVTSEMSSEEGNFVGFTPQLKVNGYKLPLNSGFPTTGFEGASFNIQPKYAPKNYDWSIVDGQGLLSINEGANVKISGVSDAPLSAVITGTGKANSIAADDVISIPINIKSWFAFTPNFAGYLPDPLEAQTASNSFAARWCRSQTPSMELIKVENYQDLNNKKQREVNGTLFGEWGAPTSYNYPNLKHNTENFWAQISDDLDSLAKITDTSTIQYDPYYTTTAYGICTLPKTIVESKVPEIKNLTLSGKVELGSQLEVNYEFISHNSSPNIDKSYYSFSSGTKAGTSLNLPFEALSNPTVVPANANGRITLPALTQYDVNSILSFSILPRNSDGKTGKIQTINSIDGVQSGNLLTFKPAISVSSITYPFDSRFPRTAFTGASYRIVPESAIGNYEWQIENAGNEVLFDDKTGFIKLQSPIIDGRTVKIQGLGRQGTPVAGKSVNHQFSIERWVERSGRLCETAFYNSRILPANLFSNSVLNGRVEYNQYYSSGRGPNGLFWHEWGSVYGDGIVANSFTGSGLLIADSYFGGISSESLVGKSYYCELLTSPVNTSLPEIKNVTIEADPEDTLSLIVKFDFITNNQNTTHKSIYSAGDRDSIIENIPGGLGFRSGVYDASKNQFTIYNYRSLVSPGKVLTIAILPVNSQGIRGDMVIVDTGMTYEDGNKIMREAPKLVTSEAKFPLGSTFPVNGFVGADFDIQPPYSATNYDWDIDNLPAGIEFNPQVGSFVMVDKINKQQEVTVNIRGKAGTIASGQSYTHKFTIKKWIDLPDFYTHGYYEGVQGYDPEDEYTSPELACKKLYPESRTLSIVDYSSMRKINASLAYTDFDTNKMPGHEPNGLLYSEWGGHNALAYKWFAETGKDLERDPIERLIIYRADNSMVLRVAYIDEQYSIACITELK